MNALLIAGTDTSVGKTVLVCALAAYWQTYSGDRPLGIMKPVQCGGSDRELYTRLFSLDQSPADTNPIYFESPLAAPIAANYVNQRIDLRLVWKSFEALTQQKELVLLEGPDGLGSPITHETTLADLAWDWRIPTVLVVPVRRGAIGQAVANVALARQAKVHIKGIVLNCLQPCSEQEAKDWVPPQLVRSLTGVPILGQIPHLSDPTDLSKLAQVASNLDLEGLIPLSF